LIRMLACWYCCLLELYMDIIMALEIEFTQEIAAPASVFSPPLSSCLLFLHHHQHHHQHHHHHHLSLHLFYFFSSFPNPALIPFLISDLSFPFRIIPSNNYVKILEYFKGTCVKTCSSNLAERKKTLVVYNEIVFFSNHLYLF